MRRRIHLIAILFLSILAPAVQGQNHILLPDRPSVKRGEKVSFQYQFGRAYRQVTLDVEKPKFAVVIDADGKSTDVLRSFEKVARPGIGGDKKVNAYTFDWTPTAAGDYVVFVQPQLADLDGDKLVCDDTVQLVIHVEAQKGWERRPMTDELTSALRPITRPYGLRPNMVFQSEARWADRIAYPMMEFERYNAVAPPAIPAAEHVTYSSLTGPDGTSVFAFPEAGWWGVTAVKTYNRGTDYETVVRGGKTCRIVSRATMWVHVDADAPRKAAADR
jgi:Domain of unknown function (DUF4198)